MLHGVQQPMMHPMERVTVSIDEHLMAALKQQAGEEGISVSAYAARALQRRMQSAMYHAAAAAERDHPPTDDEIAADAAHYTAADAWERHNEVSGAA